MVARVGGAKRKRVTASFWASELGAFNFGWKMVNGTCGGGSFTLGPLGIKMCEEFAARVGHSSATFEIRGWSIRVEGRPVYNRVSGPHHRLDVAFSGHEGAPARSLPHGLLGQAFSTPELARVGKLDVYPEGGHFITSAMAEGAIDGEVASYEVGGPHETRFVFSRFDGADREEAAGAEREEAAGQLASGDAATTD